MRLLAFGRKNVSAKTKLLSIYCTEWYWLIETRKVVWPGVLDAIHADARAEVLAYYGIVVGEN